MRLIRRSPLTGVELTRDIDVTEEQIVAWRAGALIQRAMPALSPEDREWVKTGYTPEDWNAIFPDTEEV